jgi:mRNA interferase HicA
MAAHVLHNGSTETAKGHPMKCSEFRRWLKARGVEFQSTKGSHFKVSLNGKSTIFPDHGAKEIAEGLRKTIIKQLGLKD